MDVIMRRGGRAGIEWKDLDPIIELSHLVRGSSIYLERGCPLRHGEYRAIICLSERNENVTEDRALYHFTEVGEYPVHGEKMLSSYKKNIFDWVNSKLNITLNSRYDNLKIYHSEFRLRERISDRLVKVYRDRPLKEQGILEKRMIAIERMQPGQGEWMTPKEVLILVRYWD